VYASKAANYTHAAEVRSLISRQFGVPKITTLRISAKPNLWKVHPRHHAPRQRQRPIVYPLQVSDLKSDAEIFSHSWR
jgi:hypothetical protein